MSVFIGSLPNTENDDVVLAKKVLRDSNVANNSLEELKIHFSKNSYFFNKGRDSLFFLFKLLGLKQGDEVITQAFSCIAVLAPIIWSGATPVYVDIETNTFNMDLKLLRKKITLKTKAIIIQHTFGNIANLEMVKEIVEKENCKRDRKNKIYIIEDCAQLFDTNLEKYGIGKYSDAYFFSFSQDKGISCTQGSVLEITNEQLKEKAKEEYKKTEKISDKESKYCAKYIKVWDVIKKSYFITLIPFTNITLGRVLIMLFRSLGIIKRQASIDTLKNPDIKKMGDIQACLLLNQLRKVEKLNKNRERVVNRYNSNLKSNLNFNSKNKVLLRYPILVDSRNEIKRLLLKKQIIIGNWYSTPVYPLSTQEELLKVGYVMGSCPIAENVGKKILNLPTNIEVKDNEIKEIIDTVNTFAKPIKI